MAVRAELAVEQFAGSDLERLNELSRLGEHRTSPFLFSGKEKKRERLTSHMIIKSPSWISLFWDHIWRCCRRSGVSDYSTRSKRKRTSCSPDHVDKKREIRFPKPNLWKSR